MEKRRVENTPDGADESSAFLWYEYDPEYPTTLTIIYPKRAGLTNTLQKLLFLFLVSIVCRRDSVVSSMYL